MERNIQTDRGALDELQALGFRTVPLTVIGKQTIPGFNPKLMAEALQLGLKGLSRDPSETIPIIERALEAVERAIRQMPDEKVDWAIPDRKRPMREFTYHIFATAQRTVEHLDTGVITTRPDEAGLSYTSFRDIADYGRSVIGQFRTWAARADMDALRSPPAGSKDRSGAERLDVIAGHIIQHLRQVYSILEQFGITPQDRIPDSAWPSEYVLSLLW